jgi:5,10-methylene-tetrahydrofolate dehydrogenase/methenyl tetrahydrofolate cyclohydrolase
MSERAALAESALSFILSCDPTAVLELADALETAMEGQENCVVIKATCLLLHGMLSSLSETNRDAMADAIRELISTPITSEPLH